MIKTKLSINTDLGRALRLRREQLNWTQSELGKELKVSGMQLSHLENGDRPIKFDILEKWTNILGLDIDIQLVDRHFNK